jgi:hypothetical protein
MLRAGGWGLVINVVHEASQALINLLFSKITISKLQKRIEISRICNSLEIGKLENSS